MSVSLAVIVLATFVSEDLTCLATGLLIRQGTLPAGVGLAGCFLGIYLGDLGLWLLGRVAGRPLLRWSWLLRRLPARQLDNLGQWLDRRGWIAVVAARFLPGTRLPLYLVAGAIGNRPGSFALWTALASLVWVPLMVLGAALLGEAFIEPLAYLFGPGWLTLLFALLGLFLVVRLSILLCTPVGRGMVMARVSRLWRWEFWPSWLFYLPVLPWLAWLSVRHRGVLTWTAANPGIPHGGVVGESKYAILRQLPQAWVVPGLLVDSGELAERLAVVRQGLEVKSWQFPLILKPDASQRGAGVRRVWDMPAVEQYLREQPAAVIVQTYHPGPFEAGIFFYRLPDEDRGHIFSITDKQFPVLVGDGRSTLEELIWRHPRYRMQARVFLARHEAQRDRVLEDGERLPLALAGNHCQGTLFRDGSHLITPELEQTIDSIAREFSGFFIGRFDVRYRDVARFKAGQDLAIVELNGVTSESTNIYDPSWSLLAAYGTLCRQWSLLYRIGAANRDRGHQPTSLVDLLRLFRGYYRDLRVNPLAD
jgi:membrane protein DedA with SNARE-associated domain